MRRSQAARNPILARIFFLRSSRALPWVGCVGHVFSETHENHASLMTACPSTAIAGKECRARGSAIVDLNGKASVGRLLARAAGQKGGHPDGSDRAPSHEDQPPVWLAAAFGDAAFLCCCCSSAAAPCLPANGAGQAATLVAGTGLKCRCTVRRRSRPAFHAASCGSG